MHLQNLIQVGIHYPPVLALVIKAITLYQVSLTSCHPGQAVFLINGAFCVTAEILQPGQSSRLAAMRNCVRTRTE